jgi:hypothetical protein
VAWRIRVNDQLTKCAFDERSSSDCIRGPGSQQYTSTEDSQSMIGSATDQSVEAFRSSTHRCGIESYTIYQGKVTADRTISQPPTYCEGDGKEPELHADKGTILSHEIFQSTLGIIVGP